MNEYEANAAAQTDSGAKSQAPARAEPGKAASAEIESEATNTKISSEEIHSAADFDTPNLDFWELRLYVAGKNARSVSAFANLKRICEEYLEGRYRIEVVDLMQNPQLAQGDQILAVPTLVRRLPPPLMKIIGDLSNTERTLVGLNLIPRLSAEADSSATNSV